MASVERQYTRQSFRQSASWSTALAIVVVAIVLSGCTTGDIVQEVSRSVERSLTKQRVLDSFLMTNLSTFYPQGVPPDIEELPTLDSDQISLIHETLNGRLAILISAVADNEEFLAEIFASDTLVREAPIVKVRASGERVPKIAKETIFVDVKAVQIIFRALLLNVVSAEKDDEVQALRTLIELKQWTNDVKGVVVWDDVSAFLGAYRQSGSFFEGLGGTLENRLRTEFVLSVGDSLQTQYLDALDFVLAHELAHYYLRHDSQRSSRSVAELELEADTFAVLLQLLEKPQNTRPLNKMYTASPNVWGVLYREIDGVWYSVEGPRTICPVERFQDTCGFAVFFENAYGIAGYDKILSEGSEYPPRETRLEQTNTIRRATLAGLTDAQRFSGNCVSEGTRSKFRESPYEEIIASWKRSARKRATQKVGETVGETKGNWQNCTTSLGNRRSVVRSWGLEKQDLAARVFAYQFQQMD